MGRVIGFRRRHRSHSASCEPNGEVSCAKRTGRRSRLWPIPLLALIGFGLMATKIVLPFEFPKAAATDTAARISVTPPRRQPEAIRARRGFLL